MNIQALNEITIDRSAERMVYSLSSNNMQNIFIYGAVPATRRTVALALTEELVRKNILGFSGTATHFSLIVPSLSNHTETVAFVDQLMKCVAIAAGYYSCFRGVVILEFEEKPNPSYCGDLFRYIRFNQSNICFIIYSTGDQRQSDALYRIFSSYGRWRQMPLRKPSPEVFCDIFLTTAENKKIVLSQSAREALQELAYNAELDEADVAELAESMTEQLIPYIRKTKKTITAAQIKQLVLPEQPMVQRTIGFGLR